MSNLLSLADYILSKNKCKQGELMAVKKVWKSLSQGGVYFDLACSPPFNSHKNLFPIRREVLNCIPPLEDNINKLFMPFTFNAEPFYSLGVEECYFNHRYEPFTVLFYVMRDHYTDLYDFVSGVVVASEDQYEEYRYQFNKIFKRVLEGKGRGRTKGLCSEDEMIRIGSLFYILQKSCQNVALEIDSDRMFLNKWNGQMTKISTSLKEFSHYAEKLKKVSMSGLDWKNFFFRYVNETDENSLWIFHLPKAEDFEESSAVEQEFTYLEYYHLFDNLLAISKRGGSILLLIEHEEELLENLVSNFKFVKDKECFANNYFHLYPEISEGPYKYMAVTNYSLSDKNKFKKIKIY
jgi:hypothetical protein